MKRLIIFFCLSTVFFSCKKENLNEELLQKNSTEETTSYLKIKIYSEYEGFVFYDKKLNLNGTDKGNGKIRFHFDETNSDLDGFILKNMITLTSNGNIWKLDNNSPLILLGYWYLSENESNTNLDLYNNIYAYHTQSTSNGIKFSFDKKCYISKNSNCVSDWNLQKKLNDHFNALENYEQNKLQNLTIDFEMFIESSKLTN